ncbi:MAG: septal ring lytic transglycosylase RlpA family protein [Myxococcota bacterium]
MFTMLLWFWGCADRDVEERPAVFQVGTASWYGDDFAGSQTASGATYDPKALTAAHRGLPFGTVLEVERLDAPDGDDPVVQVEVNDRGPYADGRILDLSRQAAAQLGMLREGTAEVALRIVRCPDGEDGCAG